MKHEEDWSGRARDTARRDKCGQRKRIWRYCQQDGTVTDMETVS